MFYLADINVATSFHGIIESCLIPLFFGASIFIIIHANGFISRSMDSHTAQYLGKTSYSIYLNHAIVLMILPVAIFKVFKVPQTPLIELTVCAFVVVVVIVYSHFTYKIVEVGGSRLLKKMFNIQRPVAASVRVSKP
jgi:peptidoglycan/LPS O-acetylase OafA/YrhL